MIRHAKKQNQRLETILDKIFLNLIKIETGNSLRDRPNEHREKTILKIVHNHYDK